MIDAPFINMILTAALSGAAAWAAVRVNIWWIIKTLDRHEDYHKKHFQDLANVKGVKYVKR